MKYQRNQILFALGLITLTFSNIRAQENPDGKKPNIIFLLTDDQRWDAMGAMGNPVIKTPNMDKPATEGVLFLNGYVTTSICCASRASILTGQYESRHQINDFNTNAEGIDIFDTYSLKLCFGFFCFKKIFRMFGYI